MAREKYINLKTCQAVQNNGSDYFTVGSGVIPHPDKPGQIYSMTVATVPQEYKKYAELFSKAPELRIVLEAIQARIKGEWDNPALKSFGTLGTIDKDILRYIESVIDWEGNLKIEERKTCHSRRKEKRKNL